MTLALLSACALPDTSVSPTRAQSPATPTPGIAQPPTVTRPPIATSTPTTVAPVATATRAPVARVPTPSLPERFPPQAFGQLPLIALPGEGGFRPRLALSYERGSELPALPGTTDVYRLHWPIFTLQSVRELGQRLGLTGEVERLGPDTFQLEDSARGRLFVAHGRLVYFRTDVDAPAPARDPVRSAEQAREWLEAHHLLPPNAGPAEPEALPDGLARVVFALEGPRPIITPEPAITLVVDGAARVLELNMLWPARQEVSAYPLADLPTIWEAVERGDGYVEIDAQLDGDSAERIGGQARLTQLAIGYALAGGADAGEPAFLEPLFIFSGLAQLNASPAPVAIRVYVPAVEGYRWPSG